jgi:hypothetical protein
MASSNLAEWKKECGQPLQEGFTYQLHTGPLASGNLVVDSDAFKKRLKLIDRKLIACEMEVAGFMLVEHLMPMTDRLCTQFISLRGISDMAANKAEVERVDQKIRFKGDVEFMPRELAMRNATLLLLALLESKVLNADPSHQTQVLQAHINLLQKRKRKTGLHIPGSQVNITKFVESLDRKEKVLDLKNDTEKLNSVFSYLQPDSTAQLNELQKFTIIKEVLLKRIQDFPSNQRRTRKKQKSTETSGDPLNKPPIVNQSISSTQVNIVNQIIEQSGSESESDGKEEGSALSLHQKVNLLADKIKQIDESPELRRRIRHLDRYLKLIEFLNETESLEQTLTT